MKIVISPRYEAASASHLIAASYEKIHGENAPEDVEYLTQPISESLPYLLPEHQTILEKVGHADTLIVMGRPSTVEYYLQYGNPENVVLWCQPMLQAEYSDYMALKLLTKRGAKFGAFDIATQKWLERYAESPCTLIKLDLNYPRWQRTQRQAQDGLRIMNTMYASASRMVALGLKGVTVVTTPTIAEALKTTTPLYADRGLTEYKGVPDPAADADCFVIDKSITLLDMLSYFSEGLYPVIGAQFEESVFLELERLLNIPEPDRPVMKVFSLSEKVPEEAERCLENITRAVEEYSKLDAQPFADEAAKVWRETI